MKKIILMCGIPNAGKTTMAKELSKKYNIPRISRDSIKEMFYGKGLGGENFDLKLQKKLKDYEKELLYNYIMPTVVDVLTLKNEEKNLKDDIFKQSKKAKHLNLKDNKQE